jgi:hypothetical protein
MSLVNFLWLSKASLWKVVEEEVMSFHAVLWSFIMSWGHFNNIHGSVTALAKTTLLYGIAVSIFLSL